ncbi:MAG: putative aminoacrylate hydrolase RutD [Turneriella sp.]|nr:putative aminoacrylate hydrolase RutD [Turneriella sp.]
MKRRFFQFQNLQLSYLEAGEQHPQKVLIAHANGYAAGMYGYIVEALKDNYHVCAIDFAGHGESQASLDFNSWNFFRDQVVSLIEHKKWKSCIGIGHSLGGGSILRAAIDAPSRFTKIIGFDPVVLSYLVVVYIRLFGNNMAKTARNRRAVFKSKEQAYKIFERHPANKSWQKESVRAYVDYCIEETSEGARLKCSREVEAQIFSLNEWAHLRKLHQITCEVHLVLPEKSHVCPHTSARRITKGNPLSTVEHVPHYGHLLPFENHALVLELLKKSRFCATSFEKFDKPR